MGRWIALLRGINVGGKNVLPMKELVRDLESLSLTAVKTYIQSGNVVFDAPRAKPGLLASRIGDVIHKRHGFAPDVLVLSQDQLQTIIAENPFPEAETEPKSLHVLFPKSTPRAPDLEAMAQARAGSERFRLTDRAFYLHAPDGIGRSKLAHSVEKHLGVPATGRNWRTVLKLSGLAGDSG